MYRRGPYVIAVKPFKSSTRLTLMDQQRGLGQEMSLRVRGSHQPSHGCGATRDHAISSPALAKSSGIGAVVRPLPYGMPSCLIVSLAIS
jgi:hypothetical protein